MLYVSEETAKSVVTMADAIEAIEGVFCEIGRGEAKVFPVVMGHGPKPGTSFSPKTQPLLPSVTSECTCKSTYFM